MPTKVKSRKCYRHEILANKREFNSITSGSIDCYSNADFYNPTHVRRLCQAMYLNRYGDNKTETISICSSSSSNNSSDRDENDSLTSGSSPARVAGAQSEEIIAAAAEEGASIVDSLLDGLESLTIHGRTSSRTPESYQGSIDSRARGIRLAELTLGPPKYDFDALFKATEFVKSPALSPLTDEEEALVKQLMRRGQSGEIAQNKTAIVEYKDIYKLAPETWLNDEIINFYMQLIVERAENNSQLPSVHCFNTFFCSTLRDSGYAKVRRWTKRVDIFSKDIVFIPINYSYHWTLGVIDMKAHTIQVYDSLGGSHDNTLMLLKEYLAAEHEDKKKQPVDLSDWKTCSPKDIPQQRNMSDCGVFACTFAERLSRRHSFNFSQDDMSLIRKRMILSIAQNKIA
ncbi:hypothetical protein BX666DRAFT_1890489 [Dichotomocladium elegans]|nr:hypothetical protein BX666DRAFT_1890489 [Dichotomocladium elegans]